MVRRLCRSGQILREILMGTRAARPIYEGLVREHLRDSLQMAPLLRLGICQRACGRVA